MVDNESSTVQPFKATILLGFGLLDIGVVLIEVVFEFNRIFFRVFDRVFLRLHGVSSIGIMGIDETGGTRRVFVSTVGR